VSAVGIAELCSAGSGVEAGLDSVVCKRLSGGSDWGFWRKAWVLARLGWFQGVGNGAAEGVLRYCLELPQVLALLHRPPHPRRHQR
jgi:hypothetical protein